MDPRILIRIKPLLLVYRQEESKGNKTKAQIARNSMIEGTEEPSPMMLHVKQLLRLVSSPSFSTAA